MAAKRQASAVSNRLYANPVKFKLKTCYAAAAGELFRARKFRIRLLRIACCLLLGCYFLLSISAAEPDKLSVYASQARYSIPILSLDGRQYVGILELIGPLGTPELKSEGK